MLFALQSSSLENYLLGKMKPLQMGIVGSAIIGATDRILDEYNARLSGNLYYLAWFGAAESKKRIRIIKNSNLSGHKFNSLSSVHNDYLPSSYFCGFTFVVDNKNDICTNDNEILSSYGIKTIDIEELSNEPLYGDNPLAIIDLSDRGNRDISLISKYFKDSTNVTIYDKFIDMDSLNVIKYCCIELQNGANVSILTKNDKSCLGISILKSQLERDVPNCKFICHHVDSKTAQKYHDRFFFIDNRLQIEFTRGTNCFIKTPSGRSNRDGRITIYDCYNDPYRKKYDFVLSTGKKYFAYGYGR
jgi:hypothetical protein